MYSKSTVDFYSLRAMDGTEIDRRNVVTDLYLAGWSILPDEMEPFYEGPRLSIVVDLRMAGDLGVYNNETSPARLNTFVPGLQMVALDSAYAYLELIGLWQGRIDLKGGRQIVSDAAGFFAFDGLTTVVHFTPGAKLSLYGGADVTRHSPLGYDNYQLNGVDDGGRAGLDDRVFTTTVSPRNHLALGGELAWVPTTWLEAAIAARMVGIKNNVEQRLVAGRLFAGTDRFFATGEVELNPMLDNFDSTSKGDGTRISYGALRTELALGRRLHLIADYTVFRPVFTASSIFNVFNLIPKRDAGAGLRYDFDSGLFAESRGFVRFTTGGAVVDGGGGQVSVGYRADGIQLMSRFLAEGVLGAIKKGVDMGGWIDVFDTRMQLGMRLAYWYLEDMLYRYRGGNYVGYVASFRFKLTPLALLSTEFENYYGGFRGGNWTFLSAITVDLWK